MLAPIVNAVQLLVWRVLALFGVRQTETSRKSQAHEEIRGTVDLHHKEGAVEREHRDMIGGILDLRELQIGDVMIHRKNIDSDRCRPAAAGNSRSRARVQAHARAALARAAGKHRRRAAHQGHRAAPLSNARAPSRASTSLQLATPPWFVPETTTLEEQLDAFRERRSHFALVVDEYGALQGLVTLEDILDEIFGDIPDEHEDAGAARCAPAPGWFLSGRRHGAGARTQPRAGLESARRRSHDDRRACHPRSAHDSRSRASALRFSVSSSKSCAASATRSRRCASSRQQLEASAPARPQQA